jgi:hypothetical protein
VSSRTPKPSIKSLHIERAAFKKNLFSSSKDLYESALPVVNRISDIIIKICISVIFNTIEALYVITSGHTKRVITFVPAKLKE